MVYDKSMLIAVTVMVVILYKLHKVKQKSILRHSILSLILGT